MAVQYGLKIIADLESKGLDTDVKKAINKLKAQNLDVFNIRVKTDNDGIKSFSVKARDAFGNITTETGKYAKAVDGVIPPVQNLTTQTEKVGKQTNYFASSMMQSIKTAAQYALSIGLIYKALGELGKGIEYIRELDKEMTAIQVVGDYSNETIKELSSSYNQLARELGRTTIQISRGSLEFIRQGKTIEETNELVRQSAMMAQLGNLSAEDSTEKLTAVMNAYGVEVKDVGRLVDSLVQVDNVASTSIDELTTAMQKSAFSAQEVGVDFHNLTALIGAVSSQTRLSAETIGTALNF